MYERRFGRTDFVDLLVLLTIILFICLVLWLQFLLPEKYKYVETIAKIRPCIYENNAWTSVYEFNGHDKVYICGETNKISETFELEIFEEQHEDLVYLQHITATEDKNIQYHVVYDFPPGTYVVKLNNPRKTYATTKFTVTEE
jgi:hypothetical protein